MNQPFTTVDMPEQTAMSLRRLRKIDARLDALANAIVTADGDTAGRIVEELLASRLQRMATAMQVSRHEQLFDIARKLTVLTALAPVLAYHAAITSGFLQFVLFVALCVCCCIFGKLISQRRRLLAVMEGSHD